MIFFLLFSVLFFLAIGKIFDKSLRAKPWRFWFKIFVIGTVCDIASTYFAIYGHYEGSWSKEANVIIQMLGPVVGFDIALPFWKILLIFLFYGLGVLSNRFWQRQDDLMPFSKFIALLAIGHIFPVLNNVLVGIGLLS